MNARVLMAAGIVIAIGAWIYLNAFSTPENGPGMKTFSCATLPGITFNFPVFNGWSVQGEPVSVSPNECRVTFNAPQGVDLYEPVVLSVKKEPPITAFPRAAQKNPNGIPFVVGVPEMDHAYFHLTSYGVSVRVLNPATLNGFYVDQFIKTVIDSFNAPG